MSESFWATSAPPAQWRRACAYLLTFLVGARAQVHYFFFRAEGTAVAVDTIRQYKNASSLLPTQ